MAKKRRKKLKRTLIPKEWKVEDGITHLPEVVRGKVREALTRVKIGAEQQDNFFNSMTLSHTQRQAIAYELSLSGVSYQDIATLLGVEMTTAYRMLDRARSDALKGLPPQWRAASFINNYRALEAEAQWNVAKKDSAIDDEVSVAYSRNAITAFSKAGDFLLKAEEISKGARGGDGDKPDAADRVGMMQWVYENRLLKKEIEPPKVQDAEIIDDNEPKGE